MPAHFVEITLPGFSLADTLDCGQAFRWKETGENTFSGIHRGHFLTVSQPGDRIRFDGVTEEEFAGIWAPYFDLDTDYDSMKAVFSADPVLKEACGFCGGIRLLRQNPWEALCSFIISQNNNIPRIKGIIDRLCRQFGEPCGEDFAFPSPERLAACSLEELAPLRAGFRAKYILDAAQKVADGTVDLTKIPALPMVEARESLMQIKGVGVKVAECALLYGFHRLDAFPVDTWIKKALAEYYPDGFPAFAEPRGVAQQFLFHYIRQVSPGANSPRQDTSR